jgi:hypothetical protein
MNKTFSNKSDTNHQEKIILNKRSDLINIPIQQLRTAKLKNFSGTLFDQIYKEAIAFEHNQDNKNQFLESRKHSRSFAYKKPKEIVNNNFNDNNYIDNKTNVFEKNKMIRIINKKLNINRTPIENKIVINSINFEIKYNSTFGEEVGILGSITDLGNWNINKIFYLGWNSGNIWKGKININKPYINFEFKFIIAFNRSIKEWENGDNNKINFDSLINEIKYKKNGYLDKYEYIYDSTNKELYIKCKWNY